MRKEFFFVSQVLRRIMFVQLDDWRYGPGALLLAANGNIPQYQYVGLRLLIASVDGVYS